MMKFLCLNAISLFLTREVLLSEDTIILTQLGFYRRRQAGCLFAAYAARDPRKFNWRLSVARPTAQEITALVESGAYLPDVSTQSIIFPSVTTHEDLQEVLMLLQNSPPFSLESAKRYRGRTCLGFRVQVGELLSWVSGFGNFKFLPKTRQAPFTEIVFRTKPRPQYDWVMKESPSGIIHLADMDMKGMEERKFKSLWEGSFTNTKKILGEKPDLRTAAKTTFAVPFRLWPKE